MSLSVVCQIPAATKHFTFSSLPSSFVYDPISEREVYSQILQLDPVKAAGPKNGSINSLKNISAYNIHLSEGCI